MGVYPCEGLGKRIVDALGIDGAHGRAIAIRINVETGKPVTADVQLRLSSDGTESVLKVLEAVNWKGESDDAKGDTESPSTEAGEGEAEPRS